MQIKLADKMLPALREGDYFDVIVPGLRLRVGAKRRTWTVRYRTGGVRHNQLLGHYPSKTLADARKDARAVLAHVEAGEDPTPPEPPKHPTASDHLLTVGKLLDRYEIKRKREGGKGLKTFTRSMRDLRKELAGHLGRPARDFTKADLRKVRDAITERGAVIGANRFLGYLNPVMRWAAGEDLIAVNFVGDLTKAPRRVRKRVLTSVELAAVWHAAGRMALQKHRPAIAAFGRAVRFMMLTAQRRSECSTIKFGDVVKGTWRQMVNKADRPHSLPLPKSALDVLGVGEVGKFCFASRFGRAPSDWARHKIELDALCGVTGWTFHDLRRTAATVMQELDVEFMTIESVLNHKIAGAAGHYLHSEMMARKGKALALWADHVAALAKEHKEAAPIRKAA